MGVRVWDQEPQNELLVARKMFRFGREEHSLTWGHSKI